MTKAAMCEGKRRYGSFLGADKAARRGRVTAYHCRACAGFHVGTVDHERNLAEKNIRQRLLDKARQ